MIDKQSLDHEIDVIGRAISALAELDADALPRVLRYVAAWAESETRRYAAKAEELRSQAAVLEENPGDSA